MNCRKMTSVLYLMHTFFCFRIYLFARTAQFWHPLLCDPLEAHAYFYTVTVTLVLSLCDGIFGIRFYLYIDLLYNPASQNLL